MILRKKKHLSKIYTITTRFFILGIFLISGCAHQMTQISALRSYNGAQKKPNNQCIVVRTAIETKFTETIREYSDYMLGDSHIETKGQYENEEAAYDCMAIGAKSVLVLDRGVVSTSSAYVPGYTFGSYYPTSNFFWTYSTPGYYVSTQTSAYVVVFFDKIISKYGTKITAKEYNSWKEINNIAYCDGCK